MQNTVNQNNNVIEIASLYYEVQDRQVINGVDLQVKDGEILAVMGKSGCGKTTLLRLIMGLLEAKSGSIKIQGEDITQLEEHEMLPIRAKMGYVFQYAALFDSLTVRENVAFGLIERGDLYEEEIASEVAEKLALVGMSGTEKLYPSELSGGMQKRVGVARALVMHPEIILYDEPTAGLDPPTAASLNEMILDLRERLGVTSVIVSHDVPALAQVADRAALLDKGQILAVGKLDELSKSEHEEIKHFFLFWKGAPQT